MQLCSTFYWALWMMLLQLQDLWRLTASPICTCMPPQLVRASLSPSLLDITDDEEIVIQCTIFFQLYDIIFNTTCMRIYLLVFTLLEIKNKINTISICFFLLLVALCAQQSTFSDFISNLKHDHLAFIQFYSYSFFDNVSNLTHHQLLFILALKINRSLF